MSEQKVHVTEQEAMQVAEESRQTEWIQPSFMRGILNLKDVVYYLAVTYFFLLLATKTMEAKRWQ